MQQRGRQHEAGNIAAGPGIERHLGAVRVTVEDGEHADKRDGKGNRSATSERHNCAKHDHRDGDANLDERQRELSHP